MSKLRLSIEELTVDSFQTAEGESARGTVNGQSYETFSIPVMDCGVGTYDPVVRPCAQSCGQGGGYSVCAYYGHICTEGCTYYC